MARQLKVSVILESIAQTEGFQKFNQEMRATQIAAKKMQPTLDFIKSGVTVAATAFVASSAIVLKASQAAIVYASATNDAANAAGVTSDAIQILGQLARNNGADVGDMGKAMVQLQSNATDAARGNDILIGKFSRLGISAKDFSKLRPEEQMERFGRAIANAGSDQEALTAAMDIIGAKNAPKLMAALRELGTNGYAFVADEARKAGVVMSEEMVKKLDEAGDRFETLKVRLTILGGEFVKAGLMIADHFDPLNKALLAVANTDEGTNASKKALLELAQAYIKVGEAKYAETTIKRANEGGDLSASKNRNSVELENRKRYLSAVAALDALNAKETVKANDAVKKRIADQDEAGRATAEAAASERNKDFEAAVKAREKLDAQIQDGNAEFMAAEEEKIKRRKEIAAEGEKQTAKAQAERLQRAKDTFFDASANGYQKRGLALDANMVKPMFGSGGRFPGSLDVDPFGASSVPSSSRPSDRDKGSESVVRAITALHDTIKYKLNQGVVFS
ncbi:MAG: hypothetical protein WC661_11885 [Opitutaceae bacterium]|jgi:hypothetical protein